MESMLLFSFNQKLTYFFVIIVLYEEQNDSVFFTYCIKDMTFLFVFEKSCSMFPA